MWAWFSSWWFLSGSRRYRDPERYNPEPPRGGCLGFVLAFWPWLLALVIILILI